jgi:hypothetical protein
MTALCLFGCSGRVHAIEAKSWPRGESSHAARWR